MLRTWLALARVCSAMWVGAALLFVLTSVTEQLDQSLDAATHDHLALIRFPWYYGTGAVLIAAALIGGFVVRRQCRLFRFATVLLFLAGGVLLADYSLVYRPLRARLSPPGQERTAEFRRLHEWSERLNTVSFLMSAVASVMLSAGVATPGDLRGKLQ